MDFLDKQINSEKLSMDTEMTHLQDAGTGPIAVFTDILTRAEKEELSVEEAFAALEQIVQNMEDEGISLEDSFSCYEAGIRLVHYCSERIDRVEKKVQMLRGEGAAPMEDE